MIRFTIGDADVKQCGMCDGRTDEIGWAVVSHGINIAYADTEVEAKRARDAINDLDRLLRAVGETVGTMLAQPSAPAAGEQGER